MILLALKLFLAHILGDFVFQPDRWVLQKRKKKHRSSKFYWHGLVHGLLLLLVLEFQARFLPAVIFILLTHLLIDLLKLRLDGRRDPRWLFFWDQLAHLAILILVVYWYYPFRLDTGFLQSPEMLLFLSMLAFVTFASAVIIRQVMSSWQLAEDREEESLPRAGKYIGMLERFLVFLFIVLHQWPAIGWLIAAKSILRFSDLSRAKDRKLTEYVLIGTLLSFALAVAGGLAYLFLQSHFGL